MAEQARSSQDALSSPSKGTGKYKSHDGPRTKEYIYPTSSTPPLSQRLSDNSGSATLTLSAGSSPTLGAKQDSIPAPILNNTLVYKREGFLGPELPPTIPTPDEEAAFLATKDFSTVADLAPGDRDKAIEEMMNQAVLVDDDVDPNDALVEGIKVPLMRHQIQGYKWMIRREAGKYKGGILADDMGLGKTVQALALIVANGPESESSTIRYIVEEQPLKSGTGAKAIKKKTTALSKHPHGSDLALTADPAGDQIVEIKSKTTLIVAPVAVIRQWEREAHEKTEKGLKVFVHHGSTRCADGRSLKKYDIVLTSFATAASEYAVVAQSGGDRTRSPLFQARWLRVVLDEAHNIKNHKTQAALACFELARRSHSRWCLTGTPIQNNPYDMFSLIHFLGIPPFNDYAAFKEKIGDPLRATHQNRVNWGMKRLCLVLQTVLLRRTKETKVDGRPLLTLPERIVKVVSEPFDNDLEREFYESWEQQAKANLSRESNHMSKLVLLLRLRQATSHPSLVNKNIESDADAMTVTSERPSQAKQPQSERNSEDELVDLISHMNVTTAKCTRCRGSLTQDETAVKSALCGQCNQAMQEEAQKKLDWNVLGSTKVRILLRLLDEIKVTNSEEKTIVFSQFTSFLDLAEGYLKRDGYSYTRYDGSMRPKEREAALATIRDNKDVKIILISFKAGSTGLNLTCCSRVILMDLWYNPMLEEQGMDRAHRVGQKRDVYMYKVCIDDTVEQRILNMQEKKRELGKAALEGSKLKKGGNSLTKQELWYLFNGGEQPVSQPTPRKRGNERS